MAKKTLTPEQAEIKAMKKEKKSQNWTKFWAIVLAAVLTFSVVSLGKSQADTAIEEAKANANNVVVNNNNDAVNNNDSTNTPSTDTPSTDTPSTDTPSTDTPSTDTPSTDSPSGDAPATTDSKKTVAEAMNAATKKAASGNYEFERVCEFQDSKPITVTMNMFGNQVDATDTLNSAISGIAEGSDVNSVVGGFLGRGTKKIKVTNGVGKRYGSDGTMADLNNEEKDYMLKAMTLTEADLATATIDGNTYTFTLANISNPQKDKKNAMHHATNDFITEQQVKDGVASVAGSVITVQSADVKYYDIKFVATMDNGTLKKLVMTYKFDATMNLKVAVEMNGAGGAEVKTVYTF